MIIRSCPNVQEIRIDNAANLNSNEFKTAVASLGIRLVNSSRHNSRSQSRVERANKRLNFHLRCLNFNSNNVRETDLAIQEATLRANCAIGKDGVAPMTLYNGIQIFNGRFKNVNWTPQKRLNLLQSLRILRELTIQPPSVDSSPLFKIDDLVRVRATQQKGQNKLEAKKFSTTLYKIVSVCPQRRTYKVVKENEQPTTENSLLVHHRFCQFFKSKIEPRLTFEQPKLLTPQIQSKNRHQMTLRSRK